MTTEVLTADVAVIGSGLGGLTAAAFLAAAGRRVVVLEQHDLAGGNSQVFRRGPYEFDVGVHYLGDCAPGGTIPTILGALGVGERVRFAELDPDGFDTLVFPDFTFRVPKGWRALRANFAQAFPDEVDGFDRYVAVLRALGAEWPSLLTGGPSPTIDDWAERTLTDLLDECGFSPRARAVLSYILGTYGAAPSQASALVHALLVTHYARGAWYPEGGGQVLAARLVEVIEACGGEVRTLHLADRILVDGGAVQGVAFRRRHSDDTGVLRAPVVVSDADLPRTLLELLGPEHLDGATTQAVTGSPMSLPLVTVYAVVDIDLTDRIPNTNTWVFDDVDLDAACAGLEEGRNPEHVPFAYLSYASRKDPTNARLCPPGHTNFQVMTMAPRGFEAFGVAGDPLDGASYRRDPAYRARKQWYTDQLLDRAERVLGPLRDHLVHVECATPLTQERYTRSTGGTSYGLAHDPAHSGRHRPGFRGPVDGLFLAGASTAALHGIAGVMAGGLACAGEVLGRPLLAEVFLGTRLVDDDRLPAFDPAADPVEVSRGAWLRARRAATRHEPPGADPATTAEPGPPVR